MKLLVSSILAALFVVVAAMPASAAPFKAHEKNPNVVAYYPNGPHGIVDEPGIYHEGEDLVMRASNSGNFQQWFYGFANEDGGIIEGDHTVWREKKDNQTCSGNWQLVPEPYPEWGNYLQPGTDYCTKTNDFKSPGHRNP